MKKIVSFASLTALGVLGVVQHAAASGFAIRENSAEAVGMAYAGEGALADDPSTVFNNPAGMAFLQGNWLSAGAAAAFPTVDLQGSANNAFLGPVAGNNSGNGGKIAAIPDMYGVYHLNDRVTLGLAVTAPFGDTIKYNSNFYGRYTDLENSAISVDVNPNIAYKLTDQVSIAGGLSAQYFLGTLVQGLNQGAICTFTGACPGTTPDALLRAKGDSWGFGYNLGLMFVPRPDTHLGLTYRSKVEQQLSGNLDAIGLTPALAGAVPTGPTTVDIALPASVGFSASHDLNDKLTLATSLQWTEWHSFASTNLVNVATGVVSPNVQHYQNSWMVSVGAQYHLTSAWTLRGGLGWDQSPVTDQYRSVSLPDQDRYIAAVGFGYAFTERLSLDAAYTHYFASHASINSSSTVTDSVGDTVSGNYQVSLDYLIASVKYRF